MFSFFKHLLQLCRIVLGAQSGLRVEVLDVLDDVGGVRVSLTAVDEARHLTLVFLHQPVRLYCTHAVRTIVRRGSTVNVEQHRESSANKTPVCFLVVMTYGVWNFALMVKQNKIRHLLLYTEFRISLLARPPSSKFGFPK